MFLLNLSQLGQETVKSRWFKLQIEHCAFGVLIGLIARFWNSLRICLDRCSNSGMASHVFAKKLQADSPSCEFGTKPAENELSYVV